jgi:hypothetical protein
MELNPLLDRVDLKISKPFSLLELSIQLSWMELLVMLLNVRLDGADGGVWEVVALPLSGEDAPAAL